MGMMGTLYTKLPVQTQAFYITLITDHAGFHAENYEHYCTLSRTFLVNLCNYTINIF
jgi:hypothetical protein